MFDTIFCDVVGTEPSSKNRLDGVAFLRAAGQVYGLKDTGYLGFNIPNSSRGNHYVHFYCSDRSLRRHITSNPISIDRLSALGLGGTGSKVWGASHENGSVSRIDPTTPPPPGSASTRMTTVGLQSVFGETAVFGYSIECGPADCQTSNDHRASELEAVGHYFHSHMLRINGNAADRQLLVSARELDCLRWIAAGKTAWEASVILGISERTVRFHLNAAREKMNCTTTTQAVARAVAQRMISV